MTQGRLAERVGTSQQWISRVERGGVDLRLTDAERLIAAVGKRLLVQAVPAGDDRSDDPDLVAEADMPRELEQFVQEFGYVWRRFRPVPYVVGGRLAALAQGLPVRPLWLDLVITESDLPAANAAMAWLNAARWSEVNQDYTNYDCDLDRPWPRRFRLNNGLDLRVQIVTGAVSVTRVTVDGQTLPVVALGVLLRDDPDVAELAARLAV
jgi:transcriptional regulator with XRE-family HTH domain